MHFRIRKGLDIPIAGAPEQVVSDGAEVTSVALFGHDWPGMRTTMLVEAGDRVKTGQPLFADRKRPEILFTSPGCGVVTQINRGDRRVLESVVVELAGDEEERFTDYPRGRLSALGRDEVREGLLASGLWTAFRTRPFGRVPDPGSEPHSLFVTAMDSNPLAADAGVVVGAHREDFATGLDLVSRLTDGRVFLCTAPGSPMPEDNGRVTVARFAGPHPAGLPGTHIHLLDPAGATRTVWHVGYQDVIAIGRLFATGRLWTERIVALGGPPVRRPRLIRTRLGASTDDLIRAEVDAGSRVISGSVLSGHTAAGRACFLGRYHTQISVIAEDPDAGVAAAPAAGRPRYSATSPLAARLARGRTYSLTAAVHGRPTVMLPIGCYERVMPLDILPVPLLRALLVGDTDMARDLGCLELDEEDLALCSFVCPGKNEYGPLLRSCLARLEREA